MPATISITPTTYIVCVALSGLTSRIQGARYFSQFTSTFANLSAPNRIGATVKPILSSQKAWYAGSAASRLLTGVAGSACVGAGDVTLVTDIGPSYLRGRLSGWRRGGAGFFPSDEPAGGLRRPVIRRAVRAAGPPGGAWRP